MPGFSHEKGICLLSPAGHGDTLPTHRAQPCSTVQGPKHDHANTPGNQALERAMMPYDWHKVEPLLLHYVVDEC